MRLKTPAVAGKKNPNRS